MIVVQRLTDDADGSRFEEIGRVRDGEILAGEAALTAIFDRETWATATEGEIAARLDGPRVVAGIVPDGGPIEVGARLRDPDGTILTVAAVEGDTVVLTTDDAGGDERREPLAAVREHLLDGEWTDLRIQE